MSSVLTTERQRKKKTPKPRGWRKLFEIINKIMALIAMMVSWVYTYLETHQVVYISIYSFSYVTHIPIEWLNKIPCKCHINGERLNAMWFAVTVT